MAKNPSHYEQLPESLGWLAWYGAFGVDEAMSDEPVGHFVAPSKIAPETQASGAARGAARGAERGAERTPLPVQAKRSPLGKTASPSPALAQSPAAESPGLLSVREAQALAEASHSLEALFAAIDGFDACHLRKTAEKTVYGDGMTPDRGTVAVMVLGGAPGDSDDREGKAFSGEEGKWLDQILATIDLSRETNCYLSRAIFWRPPGNREPTPLEKAQCRPFLLRLIALLQPQTLLLLGALPSEMIRDQPGDIASVRGKWLEVGNPPRPALVSFNPMLYLDSPVHKKLIWDDLVKFQAKILEL